MLSFILFFYGLIIIIMAISWVVCVVDNICEFWTTPRWIYENTRLNWIGTFFVYLGWFIINPIWNIVIIISYLATVGRNPWK